MFLGNGSNVLEFLPREDFAYRVVRCIDNNHLGSRRDRPALDVVSRWARTESIQTIPELIEINCPVITGRFITLSRRMQRNVNRFPPIKRHRWEILVEEWFEHDDFVTVLKKSHKDRVLSYM